MKGLVVTMLLSAAAVFSTACSPRSSPAPAAPSTTQEKTTASIEVSAWQKEWARLTLAAKKEGTLVIYSSMAPLVRDALVDNFVKKFGIRLEIVTGRGGEINAKLLGEKRAGLTIVDIVHGGSSDMTGSLKPSGVLDAMKPAFLLPELVDPEVIKKTWWSGELLWADKEQMIFVTFAHASANLALNTNMVKPEEVQSFKDLLEPKWKEKIILHDPTVSGAGGKWFSVFGSQILGWDYMRALAKQEPAVIRDARLQVEWLAKGKYAILIAPRSPIFLEFKEAGAPIWRGIGKEGTYLSGAGGTFALIKDRPHPIAAKFFMNWISSKEGQTILARGYGLPSARVDVSTEGVDPASVVQPGVKYFWSESEEFLSREPEYRKLALEIFGHLLR